MVLRGRRRWLAAVVAVGCVTACDAQGGGSSSASAGPRSPSASAPGSPAPSSSARSVNNDPAHFAAPVVARAKEAKVDPQLLMAILYNEAYKPHDPDLEREWQRMKPDSAFGIANMHKAAFDEVKQGRDFAARSWQDLPDDPDLAIEAAAWYLHDLEASLPKEPSGSFTKDELLALGYNTGAGNMSAFARGVKPGSMARSYLDRLHDNWAKAGRAVRH